jgi:hypothetical protein
MTAVDPGQDPDAKTSAIPASELNIYEITIRFNSMYPKEPTSTLFQGHSWTEESNRILSEYQGDISHESKISLSTAASL